jgi:predicted nuclease with TOPRIM domain
MSQKKLPRKEEKDGQIQRLRNRIRRLEKENERLKQEIKTLETYRDVTNKYIDEELDGIPVERVIRGVEKHQNLKKVTDEVKPVCPKCLNRDILILGRQDGKMHLCKCGYKKVIKDE